MAKINTIGDRNKKKIITRKIGKKVSWETWQWRILMKSSPYNKDNIALLTERGYNSINMGCDAIIYLIGQKMGSDIGLDKISAECKTIFNEFYDNDWIHGDYFKAVVKRTSKNIKTMKTEMRQVIVSEEAEE